MIVIHTIDHQFQRYNTVGDWRWTGNEKDILTITVSKMSDWRREFLVGVHELIEAMLCKHDGVKEEQVDKFDLAADVFDDIEPGDHPQAPYQVQHCIATGVERLLAAVLGVDWYTYECEIGDLTQKYEALRAKRERIYKTNQ